MNDGKAIVDSVSGGNGIFTYSWDVAAGSQTTDTASMLNAGTYWVTVTDQKNCTDSTDITVLEPNSIVVYTSSVSVSCFGLSDGKAVVDSVSGGNGVFTYLWDILAGNQTTDTASNLTVGTYSVNVSDQNNCIVDLSLIHI